MCSSALGLIGIWPRKFTGRLVTGAVLAALTALSGCGGDDDSASTAPAATTATETATTESAPTATAEVPPETAPETTTQPTTTGEAMPGGGGDEEPARTLALFTGRGGRITPRVVRVPAFIHVQIELRSADGATYGLRFGDTTITAGGELNSFSTTIDALRPGEAVTGRPTAAGNPVRISATAEPGP